MSEKQSKNLYKLHGIQLLSVHVVELSIKLNEPPDCIDNGKIDFNLSHGHSKYNNEEKTIQVGTILKTIGDGEKPPPIQMKIELFGLFKVDESKFFVEHIEDWANGNAPIILYPFLREHAYSLTMRCGLPPAMLPLLEVPTLTSNKTEK